jgi:hypothetical protein
MFPGINSAICKQTYTLRVCKSEIMISLTIFCSENCCRIVVELAAERNTKVNITL